MFEFYRLIYTFEEDPCKRFHDKKKQDFSSSLLIQIIIYIWCIKVF